MPSPSAPPPGNAPKPASPRPRRERLFEQLARLSTRFPTLVVGLFALLSLLAYLYIQDFPIRTAYLELLPKGDPLVRQFEAVQEETASTDVVAILFTLTSPAPDRREAEDRLTGAAERVLTELRVDETPELEAASYRVGEGVPVPSELVIFRTLSPSELDRLRAIAEELGRRLPPRPDLGPWDGGPPVGDLSWTDPAAVDRAVAELVGGARAALGALDGVLAQRELVAEAARIVKTVLARQPPPATGEPILSRDGSRLVLQVWPTRRPVESLPFNQKVTQHVRDALGRAQGELQRLGVSAEITGTYVTTVEADAAIRRDMALVTAVSSGIVFGLVFLAFASLPLCLCALTPVLVSALFTMAWAKFAVGGFNLLTVFLPALILGLGIDYSVHILSRYVEERARGERVREALVTAVRTKGTACLTAALTTAAVFACLLLSHSRALYEMGVISGVGILLSLGTTVLLTPALVALVVRDRRSVRWRPIVSTGALQPAYRRFLRLRPGVVAVALLLTAALAYQASRVEFRFVSDDLAPPTPAMTTLNTVIREFGGDVWLSYYFRFFVDRPEDIRPLEEKLLQCPIVHSVASVRELLPQELLGRERSILHLPLDEAQEAVQNLIDLLERWEDGLTGLTELLVRLPQAELASLVMGNAPLAEALSRGFENLWGLLQELEGVDVAGKRAGLVALEGDLATIETLVAKIQGLPAEAALLDQILKLLPLEIRARYATRGTPPRYIVEARLLPNLHEGDNLRRFLEFADGLGADRFGLPEVTAQLETYMKNDFLLSSALALAIIFVLVWRDFPRPWEAALALAPLGMGYVWMLAGMNLLGIAFNFTNIVISPLLIGIGVDSAVHLLHRVEEERAKGGEATVRGAAASAIPIAVSSFTTMASFGALLAAHTPGLRLLGASALLGLGFTLLWSLTFLPAAVAAVVEKRKPRE